MKLTWFEFDFRRVLENTDKGLHPETGQDNGDPAKGSQENRFSTGFNHRDKIGFESDSAHCHDDEEF